MSHANSKIEPIFVVGMNGSGTTMLLDNLGHHPELYAFPRETRLIPYLYGRRDRFGDLDDDSNFLRLWQEVIRIPAIRHANDNDEISLPQDWREHPRNLASVLNGVFMHFASRQNKRRWCEKTPQHVQHIGLLAELFPHSSFIHVVRDGRDCAASFNRRWHRTPELTVYRWKKVLCEGRRQGLELGPQRYMEIRYEDITQDPEAWLRRVCNFLDVTFHKQILESSQPYLQQPGIESESEELGRIRPNSGNWKQFFSPRRSGQLEKIAGSTLSAFGYSTELPDSDRNPTRLQLRMWALKDAVRQYGREIRMKLRGEIARPWSVILSRPLVAYRQRHVNKF